MVINTCGFINDAKKESIERIFELAQYKEDGKKLIVSGCLSERYPQGSDGGNARGGCFYRRQRIPAAAGDNH